MQDPYDMFQQLLPDEVSVRELAEALEVTDTWMRALLRQYNVPTHRAGWNRQRKLIYKQDAIQFLRDIHALERKEHR